MAAVPVASPLFPTLIAQSTISSQVSTAGVQLISESRSWYHHVGVGCLHVSVLETSMLYFKDLRSHHQQVHSKQEWFPLATKIGLGILRALRFLPSMAQGFLDGKLHRLAAMTTFWDQNRAVTGHPQDVQIW